MPIPQLQQIPEQRQTRNLRQILDLGNIGAIQVANNKVYDGDDRDPDRCGRHVAATIPSSDRKCREKNTTSLADRRRFISAVIVLRRDYSVASKEQDDYRREQRIWSPLWLSDALGGGISGVAPRGGRKCRDGPGCWIKLIVFWMVTNGVLYTPDYAWFDIIVG